MFLIFMMYFYLKFIKQHVSASKLAPFRVMIKE
jgi:hypothetical protein